MELALKYGVGKPWRAETATVEAMLGQEDAAEYHRIINALRPVFNEDLSINDAALQALAGGSAPATGPA